MSKADDGLRRLLQDHLIRPPDWRATPLETGGTVSGVPDLHWAHRATGLAGWIECKATDGWAVELRPHQVGWLRWHVSAGIRCHIAVRARGVGSSRGAGDSLWLLRGTAAEMLADSGLGHLPNDHVLGVWTGPPRTWDWVAVGAILVRLPA